MKKFFILPACIVTLFSHSCEKKKPNSDLTSKDVSMQSSRSDNASVSNTNSTKREIFDRFYQEATNEQLFNCVMAHRDFEYYDFAFGSISKLAKGTIVKEDGFFLSDVRSEQSAGKPIELYFVRSPSRVLLFSDQALKKAPLLMDSASVSREELFNAHFNGNVYLAKKVNLDGTILYLEPDKHYSQVTFFPNKSIEDGLNSRNPPISVPATEIPFKNSIFPREKLVRLMKGLEVLKPGYVPSVHCTINVPESLQGNSNASSSPFSSQKVSVTDDFFPADMIERCNKDEIKERYRYLSKVYHPDTSKLSHDLAESMFKLMNEKYGSVKTKCGI